MISKVIDKMVRITITDGRSYLGKIKCFIYKTAGKLMSVDKTKAFFMQDAMEILDREAEDYFDHDLFTKHLIKNMNYENERFVLKYVGNVVVAGKHVTKV